MRNGGFNKKGAPPKKVTFVLFVIGTVPMVLHILISHLQQQVSGSSSSDSDSDDGGKKTSASVTQPKEAPQQQVSGSSSSDSDSDDGGKKTNASVAQPKEAPQQQLASAKGQPQKKVRVH